MLLCKKRASQVVIGHSQVMSNFKVQVISVGHLHINVSYLQCMNQGIESVELCVMYLED